MPDLQEAVDAAQEWPAEHVAAAVIGADGTVLAGSGDQDRTFQLASVTKLLTAYAVLIAVEEGAVEWDTPAGPDGSTVRHLIAHTSGLAFDTDRVMGAPGTRRVYSNTGFEVLGQTVADAAGMPFEYYLRDAVCVPLEMSATTLSGSPAADGVSTAADLATWGAFLADPAAQPDHGHQRAAEAARGGARADRPGGAVAGCRRERADATW